MAAPSPMATVMQKVRGKYFPKLGDAHTKFKENPIVLTLDTALFLASIGSVVKVSIRPLYFKLYHVVTGEQHKVLKDAEIMHKLPNRVKKLEEDAEITRSLPEKVKILEEKVKILESRPTIQVPVYNTPSQAARNIIRRAGGI